MDPINAVRNWFVELWEAATGPTEPGPVAEIPAAERPSGPPPPVDEVYVCMRQSRVFGIEEYVWTPTHYRLLTPTGYRGSAPRVPEEVYVLHFPRLIITDGEDGMDDEDVAVCVPASELSTNWENVDAACVDAALPIGETRGRWMPGRNDCYSIVADALDACAIPPPPPAPIEDVPAGVDADAGVTSEEVPDAGVTVMDAGVPPR